MKTVLYTTMAFLLIATGFCANAFSSTPLSPEQVKQAIQEKLSERHPMDTAIWWQGLGPNAVSVMISMYGSSDYISQRVRLTQALGYFDDAQAVEFLKKQAMDSGEDVVRNTSIRSLGKSQGDREEDFIANFLHNEDPQTRLAAAETLQTMHSQRATDALNDFVKNEKTPWILAKLKGQPVVATGLKAVSSSDDRLSGDFEGKWRGFWVSPKEGSSGMRSDPVFVELKPQEDSTIKGSLFLTLSMSPTVTKVKNFNLTRSAGKGVNISGFLQEAGVTAAPSFDASLIRVADHVILQLKVPEKSAFLVLRKDS